MNTPSDQLIKIHGIEQSMVEAVPSLSDAGLPPAVGVKSYQVFRASKDTKPDGKGWTYHHHMDIAIWRGRVYVGWNACEKDEDTWPSREFYSTSTDGVTWDEPREMFPQGISTCLRIYFYLATNGVMLMFAGLRSGTSKTDEVNKGAMVVRQIKPDHTLGETYRTPAPPKPPINYIKPADNDEYVEESRDDAEESRWTWGTSIAMFESSPDAAFISACQEMLNNRVFLEQQDLGRLLGDRRMKWHDPANWPGGKVPGDSPKWVAGKAYSFFVRPDGLRVGVSKMGWCTSSADNGMTWAQPAVPESLVTGKAKAWAQKNADGSYQLVYNPTRRARYPLAVVTSEDGINFSGMRIVQGELPRQRYVGRFRSVGPQYTRGVSEWSNDHSRDSDNVMWLVYSMSKEDIWISRVPLPVKIEEDRSVNDVFTSGQSLNDWNLYQPKWSDIRVGGGALKLINRDPYDYAAATRLFNVAKRVVISMEIRASGNGAQSIDVVSHYGSHRAVTLEIRDGILHAAGHSFLIADWTKIAITADADAKMYSIQANGTMIATDIAFTESATDLHRVVFRAGIYRNLGGTEPVSEGSDAPTDEQTIELKSLHIVQAWLKQS